MANILVVVAVVALAVFAWRRGRKRGTCAVCSCGGCKSSSCKSGASSCSCSGHCRH